MPRQVEEYLVGSVAEIPEKGVVLVRVGSHDIGVFKVNGQLCAYENRCCHQGGPVCQGEVLGRCEEIIAPDGQSVGERFSDEMIHVVCPWHGWEYNLQTGVCAADPRFHLRRFPLTVRDGAVYVTA